MVRLVAILISITLQLVAAIFALRLMRVTRYKPSWILISIGFVLMAIKQIIKFIQFLNDDLTFYFNMADDWLSVIIAFLFTAGVFLIGEMFYEMYRANKENARAQRRLMNAVISTEERERRRFAKDLHDGLGPLLSAARMSITALLQQEPQGRTKMVMENANNAINEAISSIKEISNNLSPHVLSNFGLESAVRNFVQKITKSQSIQVDLQSSLGDLRFDSNLEIAIYRSLCELINNTLKHAQATTIGIDIQLYERTLLIEYSDNGKGFDQLMVKELGNGMGLSNISSRIKSAGGMFVIDSAPGCGTHAIIKIRVK